MVIKGYSIFSKASPSNCLLSYPAQSLGYSFPSGDFVQENKNTKNIPIPLVNFFVSFFPILRFFFFFSSPMLQLPWFIPHYCLLYHGISLRKRNLKKNPFLELIGYALVITILSLSLSLSIYIYIYIYHHHHVVPLARISLTLPRHFSLSFIAFGRSSGLHPVSSHSCCMYVRARRSTFARPYVGVHRSISLMSSSFLFLRVWFV